MNRRMAIFGTRDISVERPTFPGQQPVYEEIGYRTYSTGKLEQAIAEGYDVFIVSIRPVFGDHDRWWIELVDPERVFVNRGLLAAFQGADLDGADMFDAWRRFYRRMGLPWREDFTDLDDPRVAAIEHHGFTDGGSFRGHARLN